MISFKQFIAEARDPEYYSNYDNAASSRISIKRYKEQISEKSGVPASSISLKSYLYGADSYVFKLNIKLSNKQGEDFELITKVLHDLTVKVLETRFETVRDREHPYEWLGFDRKHHIVMSFYLKDEKK